METATLDDFMALNDQLAALVEAGVPVDVELGRSPADVVATLEKINALVARRVSQGSSLAEAIESDDKIVSPAYRSMVQIGLRSGEISAGLVESNRLARSVEQSGNTARLALLYPAIICCLAFVGLVGFCLFFVPVLDRAYRGMQVPVGRSLATLQSLRSTLPIWIGILPLGLLVVFVSRRSGRLASSHGVQSRLLSVLPGVSRTRLEERSALFAESLAKLLEGGTDLPEALQIVAETWNDSARSEASRALAVSLRQGQPPGMASHLASQFPPFLRWTLFSSDAATGRATALRMAAGIYRKAAEQRQERLRIVAPIVAGVVIGGGATLLYGLALFLPVVEMLRGLAS